MDDRIGSAGALLILSFPLLAAGQLWGVAVLTAAAEFGAPASWRYKRRIVSEAFGDLSDDTLSDRWLGCTLGGTGIKHLDHVRIAWVLVRRLGREAAAVALVDGTRLASAHYGVPERFDEALTRRWAAAVADAQELHRSPTFAEFIDACPDLARSDLLGRPAWMGA